MCSVSGMCVAMAVVHNSKNDIMPATWSIFTPTAVRQEHRHAPQEGVQPPPSHVTPVGSSGDVIVVEDKEQWGRRQNPTMGEQNKMSIS